MQRARDVATEGGLAIKGYEIQEPGPAPAAPETLPADRPATQQQKQDHAAATQAAAAFEKKAQAYAQASQIVKEAKKKETDSQHVLVRFLSGTFDPAKLALTLTDMTSGATAAVAVRTSKFKEFAETAMSKAERASKLAASTDLSFANRSKAIGIQVTNEVNAKAALNDAMATRSARVIDRFPDRVKAGIKRVDTKLVPRDLKGPSPVLKGAVKVGQRIPVAGLIFTSIGVGVDVTSGKDPTQAVVGGASSLAAGAAVGACVAGPVGVVLGGVVGVGVGFVVDEVWPD
ncbi:hypothetical protein GCM10027271_06020 [Saccharopolyspora gloriosae]|uniref:Uncharacterized protein n=1 Tax=Saccharopolyspora gloriosae TaxID=455344 RepID=A0A840NJU9_9PSEU|nr:hypothetical protein [Saccharopolyspora gloriosae]MBB5072150.1 hypothetical protein [Saccharopolyspora gloriosae]